MKSLLASEILLVVVLLGVVGAAMYFVGVKNNKDEVKTETTTSCSIRRKNRIIVIEQIGVILFSNSKLEDNDDRIELDIKGCHQVWKRRQIDCSTSQ